jgi:hypothetical protein
MIVEIVWFKVESGGRYTINKNIRYEGIIQDR